MSINKCPAAILLRRDTNSGSTWRQITDSSVRAWEVITRRKAFIFMDRSYTFCCTIMMSKAKFFNSIIYLNRHDLFGSFLSFLSLESFLGFLTSLLLFFSFDISVLTFRLTNKSSATCTLIR
jgi:hypothetical protein